MDTEGKCTIDERACCTPALNALRGKGTIQGEESATCDECPFPFCIELEARGIQLAARAYLTEGMRKLHKTKEEIASMLGVSVGTIARTQMHFSGCHWCNVDDAISGVFCRSNVFTVAYDRGKIVAVLSKHREATYQENKIISYFIDGLFPNVQYAPANGSIHSHWMIDVSNNDAARVYEKMEYLSKFTPRLR